VGRADDVATDAGVVARYLARRDVGCLDPQHLRRSLDVLVLCGSGVLNTVEVAARAFHDGVVGSILVTGGVGHSTPFLAEAVARHPTYDDVATEGRTEAAMIAEILERHHGVPATSITTEEQATNCGENAEHALRILAGTSAASILLVQDPTMQRRTHASVDHHQRLLGTRLEVVSFAPFVPSNGEAWGDERFVSLLLGEVRRLHDDEHGYGPRGAGFLDHVEVPDDVLAAAERLGQAFPNLRSRPA
jgi:DUF218 domain-containing protein